MRNKAQTAMEYLMTYGWAILIIIVVVAALYSLGVFSIKPTVACSPCFGYFAFRDYSATADEVYIRNGARTIQITGVTNGATTQCTALVPCDPGTDITITTVDATQGGTASSVDVAITYLDVDTQVSRDDTGKIHEA